MAGAVALVVLATPAFAEKRLALVIGNNSYSNLDAGRQLQKAVNDADAVGAALGKIGFEVVIGHDLTRDAMVDRLSDFSKKLQEGDTAFFFFAGHGISLDGSNYILPADVPNIVPGEEVRIRNRSIAETDIIGAIKQRGARIAVLVLDACRDNPFQKPGLRSAGQERGLARMPPTTGVFTLYSAGFGQSALDRLSDEDKDPNSVFTRILVPSLTKPGLEITRLAQDVRKQVFALAATTSDKHQQFPAFYNELLDDVYLAGAPDSSEESTATEQGADAVVRATAACDRLAVDPRDASRPPKIAGVLLDNIDAGAAIQTCSEAVKLDPRNARLLHSLGRAFFAAQKLPEAHTAFLKAANLGSSLAKLEVGQDFDLGRGTPVDKSEAVAWFRRSADAGNGEGMSRLAAALDLGDGVGQNQAEALEWYRKAAETGGVEAELDYGLALELGKGGKADLAKALGWYRKAAEDGNKFAMLRLADALSSGQGIKRDDRQAAIWYGKAASLGLPQAMTGLAILLDAGRGIEKNEAAATDWYRQAAGIGDNYAIAQLAKRLTTTRGLGTDPAPAQPVLLKLSEMLDPSAKTVVPSTEGMRGLGRVDAVPIQTYRKQAELWSVLAEATAKSRLTATSARFSAGSDIETLRADMSRLAIGALRLTGETQTLRADLYRRTRDLEDAQAELAKLREQGASPDPQVKALQDELAALKASQQDTETQISERDSQIASLRGEIDRLTRRLTTRKKR